MTESEPTPRLKSTFKSADLAAELEGIQPATDNRLKSTFNKPDEAESTGTAPEKATELSPGRVLIQRDTGHRWEVSRIEPDPREGRDGEMRAYLRNLDAEPGQGDKLVKSLDQLLAQLGEDGSAWRYES